MELSNINNNVTNLNNNNAPLQINNNNAANEISNSKEKESLLLSINDYNLRRDELSLNVQNLNDGIAQTKITENGLEEQKSILQNMQKDIDNAKNEDGKVQNSNELKSSLNSSLQQFNQIAYETKYNGQNLLSNDMYEESKNQISISTKTENFDINKPDTTLISNDIFNTYNASDLNQPQAIDQLTQKVQSSINQIQNTIDEFTEFGNKLETSARDSLQDQVNLYNQNNIQNQTNFGRESNDFSKTNVIANQGYLAASQANILQEQSVKLLA